MCPCRCLKQRSESELRDQSPSGSPYRIILGERSPPTINSVTTATMIAYSDTHLYRVRGRLLSLSSWLALTRIHFRLPSMKEPVDTVSVYEASNTSVSQAYEPSPPWRR